MTRTPKMIRNIKFYSTAKKENRPLTYIPFRIGVAIAAKARSRHFLSPFQFELKAKSRQKIYLPFVNVGGILKIQFSATLAYLRNQHTPPGKEVIMSRSGLLKYVKFESQEMRINLVECSYIACFRNPPSAFPEEGWFPSKMMKLVKACYRLTAKEEYIHELLKLYRISLRRLKPIHSCWVRNVALVNETEIATIPSIEMVKFRFPEKDVYRFLTWALTKNLKALFSLNRKIESVENGGSLISTAAPFYAIESTWCWKNTPVYDLVDGVNGGLYGVKLYSPTKLAFLAGFISWTLPILGLPTFFKVFVASSLGGAFAVFAPLRKLRKIHDLKASGRLFDVKEYQGISSGSKINESEYFRDQIREPPTIKMNRTSAASRKAQTLTRQSDSKAGTKDLHMRKKRVDEFLRNNRKAFGEKRKEETPQQDNNCKRTVEVKSPNDKLGLYGVLGLKGTESKEELSAAYISMAKLYHPDLMSDHLRKKEAKQRFQKITAAYNILKDETKRRLYNETGNIN